MIKKVPQSPREETKKRRRTLKSGSGSVITLQFTVLLQTGINRGTWEPVTRLLD